MNKILCYEILDKESRVLGYELPFVSLKNYDCVSMCVGRCICQSAQWRPDNNFGALVLSSNDHMSFVG